METPREYSDKIWKTEGMDDLSEFNIPLSSAIAMIENYCKQKNEAIEKALEVFNQYYIDGGYFYGHGITKAIEMLNAAK